MKIPEHLAFSFLLAQLGAQQEYGSVGTVLVVTAGLLPDLDGVSILRGWRCHRRYHRVLGHGLPMTLLGPALLTYVAARWLPGANLLELWAWLQVSLFCHLLTDVLFYRWPAEIWWPFSRRGYGWGWIAWNDLTPTLILYTGVAFAVCWPGMEAVPAALGLGALGCYVLWRGYERHATSRWGIWLTGGWAQSASPFWRWLTGDFIN